MAIIIHECERIEIGRVIGGIAWPGERPGFAVFVGEELYPREGEKIRHCHLIKEIEERDLGNLLNRLVDIVENLRSTYNIKVEIFIGREDQKNMSFLDLWCDKRHKEIFVSYAPHSDDGLIGYHVNILLERAKERTLHLPKGCKLKGYMHELKESEIRTANDLEHPAVAALGYSVSYLTLYKPDTYDEAEDDFHDVNRGTRNAYTGY